MIKYLMGLILSFFLVYGCTNIPSTEEIEGDLAIIDQSIEDAKTEVQKYSGGLLADLATIRLKTMETTKAMLEQKKSGINRFISIKYTIDGKAYTPPENKVDLLENVKEDLKSLNLELTDAEIESVKYSGGLLQVLSLVNVANIKNSIVFLEQKALLIKHDIPIYAILHDTDKAREPGFKPTPGHDIDKF